MNDLTTLKIVSGIGQYHTNEPDSAQPEKKLTPYLAIDWFEIQDRVDHPESVEKTRGQWVIPSSLPRRNAKAQEANGEFHLLWADLDKAPPSIPELAVILEGFIGEADYEIYNTRSATEANQKARILIPVTDPLSSYEFKLLQQVLNDKFSAVGIEPDPANLGCSQVCYLPNAGELYSSASRRDGKQLDPVILWDKELCYLRDQQGEQQAILQEAKQKAAERRSLLTLSNTPTAKDAFNQSYTVPEWLIKGGYDQNGNSFRHPNSESGNYTATVRLDDQGVWRVNTLSTADPLYTKGQGAHDAFSVFTVLFHNGDHIAALKDAGDNLLAIDGVPFNQVSKQNYMQKKEQQPKVEFDIDDLLASQERRNDNSQKESKPKDDPEKPKTPFSMKSFSLSGQSEIMKTKMLADRYVLDRIAILGQATTIYAKPNTGKTLLVLWMLIESIKAGRISGENVYYINADDDYKGLVYKTSLAEKHGFQMLAPGHNNFESVALQGYMRQMIDDETASGTVIILDTLKKFTDLMEKKKGSAFMNRAREYVSNGGTLIMLAHTNKNRDADGKAVFGGTSDVVDDCDCAFILDEVAKTNTTKQVLFENIKCRGDVANELAFSYSVEEGKHYQYRLESVELADKNATAKAKEEKIAADARAKDQEVIDAITEAIDQGITQKTPLIVAAHDCSGISKRRLTTVLTRYKGTDFSKGDLWREEVGDKNAKNYHLLSAFESTKDDYSFFKNGE